MTISTNKNPFNGLVKNWWRSIDKSIISIMFFLIALSAIMVTTASPAVAERIGVEQYYFIKRQFIFLALGIIIIFIISTFSVNLTKRISLLGFLFFFSLLIAVLMFGNEIKGSKRWLNFGSLALQPSEFIKPFFCVVNGWALSMRHESSRFHAFKLSFLIFISVASLLILQPDLGMTITISAIWFGQIFLAGISLYFVIFSFLAGISGIAAAYFLLPHVNQRINNFLNPSNEGNYQTKKSLEAITNGGFYGKGPGEGTVKQNIPDSHTDFIFAVIGEELGALICIIVIACFAYIVVRGFLRIMSSEDNFTYYAASGILMQFGIQSIINIGVNLNLLPTKGMTLPLVSYGGSSIIATSCCVGILLSLTRKRFGILSQSIKKIKIHIK